MSMPPSHRPYMLTVVLVLFLSTILAIYLLWHRAVDTSDLVLFGALYVLTGVGINAGFHRMLTHRSFRARPVTKLVLLGLGCMAIEAPRIEWAATHIKHHFGKRGSRGSTPAGRR